MLNKHELVALLPRQILTMIGGYDLDKRYEAGRETIPPVKIYIHPDWNHLSVNYDGDIALLELERAVQFNEYIQPICLWKTNFEPGTSTGIIVGYGKSEDQTKKHENIPKKIEVPIHDQEKCFLTQPNLAKISSRRTFCAGTGDGNGVCAGDSGGGIMIKINDVYYLRGIVSSSLVRDGSCDLKNYAIFTNVLKYQAWINSRGNSVSLTATDERIHYALGNGYQTFSECGTMNSISGLIQRGEFTSRREFPWMASIVIKNGGFNSSGVLVSNKHVVTYPIGVSGWNKELQRLKPNALDRVTIYLGALEHGVSNYVFGASQITLHPYLKETDDTRINDVAVVTLTSAVQFSDFIKPACLWTYNDDLNLISKSPLYAVGYGIDESGKNSNIRKYAKVTLTSKSACDNEYSNRLNYVREAKAFCVFGSDSGMACERDEYLFVKFFDKWYLRGTLARYYKLDDGTCNTQKPLLYEELARHSKWIQTQIEV